MMDDYEYEAFGRMGRDRQGKREKEEPRKFVDCVKESLKKIEDIVIVNQNYVDLDILIDILEPEDNQKDEEPLELYAARAIRKRAGKEVHRDELPQMMKTQIERLSMHDNVKKWWTSFKSVEKGKEGHFQVKKVREYLQNMEGDIKLTAQQANMFRYRDAWTYNELIKACAEFK